MSEVESGGLTATAAYLPSRIQRRGQQLLDQQCWLWGRDVKRNDGNLLMALGFERLRPPEGATGSTQYTLHISSDFRVRLWGFGMYFGGDQGIYVNRYEFVARTAAFKEGWQEPDSFGSLPRSQDLHLLAQASDWIAAYESWVLGTAGLSYRQNALQGWKETACRVSEIAAFWTELSRDIHLQAVRRTFRPDRVQYDQRSAGPLPFRLPLTAVAGQGFNGDKPFLFKRGTNIPVDGRKTDCFNRVFGDRGCFRTRRAGKP